MLFREESEREDGRIATVHAEGRSDLFERRNDEARGLRRHEEVIGRSSGDLERLALVVVVSASNLE